MTTWYVASHNPGTSSFLETDLIAVNFWVRARADGLDGVSLKSVAAGRHPEWDRRAPGVRTNFARQLVEFASAIEIDDTVITFDAATRDVVLVGTIRGRYRYEDAPAIPDHPHVRAVEWIGTIDRTGLPDFGASITGVRMTVRQLWERRVDPTGAIDDPPLAPAELPSPGVGRSARDVFTWEPETGPHRYVLRHTFDATAPGPALLVVMLNPGANHLPGFRRSTTCHAVRRWGQAHGYSCAVYLNLFSFIEPNSTFLRRVAVDLLNGPDADAEIVRVAGELGDGVAVAGWGNIPTGLGRRLYDARVKRIEALLDRPLHCLGLTQRGYPRHGRGWRPADDLVPLK